MADEANWQNHVDSRERGSVSRNVNARRVGPEANSREYLKRNPPNTSNADYDEDGESNDEDKSPRERLLDGESVDTARL